MLARTGRNVLKRYTPSIAILPTDTNMPFWHTVRVDFSLMHIFLERRYLNYIRTVEISVKCCVKQFALQVYGTAQGVESACYYT